MYASVCVCVFVFVELVSRKNGKNKFSIQQSAEGSSACVLCSDLPLWCQEMASRFATPKLSHSLMVLRRVIFSNFSEFLVKNSTANNT